ncbi:HYR domain-containing protein [Bradyrhizobium sp. 172]|uniref:beta strand repeat-containing protein n=1 Tax=Bradyrhizobium sp. 172 TaxID=2782643 RepID=UPI001FFFD4BE|nr:HYR domain-containing protein [Bradyrhizobium sp. 172]UPJ96392.1 HYR domain-containing protein [Bradyrhizobium sp. 172]
MTTYWVQVDFNMERHEYGPGGTPTPDHGPPLTILGTTIATPWVFPYSPFTNDTSTRWASVAQGDWQLVEQPNGLNYQLIITNIVEWDYTAAIGSYFIAGTQPAPLQLVGPVLSDSAEAAPDYPNGPHSTYTIQWTDFVWEQITVPDDVKVSIAGPPNTVFNNAALYTVTLSSASSSVVTVNYATSDGSAKALAEYTPSSGTVTFLPGETSKTVAVPVSVNNLNSHNETFQVLLSNASGATIANGSASATIDALFTKGSDKNVDLNSASSIQAIADGADPTKGLGGSDSVTLSNAGQDFSSGSKIGDTYSVKGGGGNYNITLGAGTDSVEINGAGISTLFAGAGAFILSAILSISGGGTIRANGNLSGGSATIGANSTLELTGSDSGTITFAGAHATLKIDGTSMTTGVISGFAPGDSLDIAAVPFDGHGYTIWESSTKTLQFVDNGAVYNFILSQPIVGGVALSSDNNGGTKIEYSPNPVSAYSTSPAPPPPLLQPSNPYSAVVELSYITTGGVAAFGTGFIIGPHTILTAAHVLTSAKLESLLGPVSGPIVTINGAQISVGAVSTFVDPQYVSSPIFNDQNEIHDFGVINTSVNLSPYGIFQLKSGFTGGSANITGYAGGAGSQHNSIQNIIVGATGLLEDPGNLGGGASGGPVWVSDGSSFTAVGIYVGSGPDASLQITPADIIEILGWEALGVSLPSKLINHYISGATVFADANGNGQLDPGEVSTTTDATGGFSLAGGTEPLVAFGGINTSTGLAFKGQLSAPSGSSVITPLTTLMSLLSSDAFAEQKVLSSFGLSSSIDLNTFDPIAAAKAGSADGAAVEIAHAKVYDTVSLIASTLVAAGGDFSGGVKEALAAIAAAIDGLGVNLTNEAQLKALVLAAAQADGLSLDQGIADSVASITVATNTLLDHKAQGGATGDALLNAIAALERVVQGTASNAIQQAGNDPGQLQALVDAFSGQKLDDAVTTTLEHLGVADTMAPSLTPVADKTLEATSAAGAGGFFAATATDNIDGTVPVVFKEGNTVVHSGDVFGLGRHTVTASTVDAAGNIASDTFKIDVVDTTGPTLAPITDQVLEATSVSGAVAFFAATATDAVDGTDPIVFKEGNTDVHSGDVFSFGTHTITASAIDAAGNQTLENFKFNVVDTIAPTLTPVANQTKEATSAAGAAFFFTATATDAVDGTDLVVFKDGNTVVHSGAIFGLGNHTLTATTIDAAGNLSSEAFTINVKDTTAPTLTSIADQTVQATTNSGAAAFFSATATDLVDGTDPIVYKEGNTVVHSGDIFGVGTHSITASTVDAAGNSASETFKLSMTAATSHTHNPIAVDDSNGVAKGKTVSVSASKGVLANDSDPDHDHLSVGSVNGSTANVGHSIKGDYGTLTLNANGGYAYATTATALPSQIFAQDTFTYTTIDGHGGSDTSTLTFSVFDPSFTYKAGSNTILWGGNGKDVLDGSGGHDVAYGGNGADVLIGGKGDVLAGGKGPDQFVFRPEFGANTILDFDVKNDHLQFDDSIFNLVKSILDHTTNTPLGALISDGHGDSVLLLGVNKTQLLAHSSDLLIA